MSNSSCLRAESSPSTLFSKRPGAIGVGSFSYAFFANSERTRNSPADEHGFQIKCGSQVEDYVLQVSVDPHALITTIFIWNQFYGKRDLCCCRSIDAQSIPNIAVCRVQGSTSRYNSQEGLGGLGTRPTPTENEALLLRLCGENIVLKSSSEVAKTSSLISFADELEQIARGREPGERHLIADKLPIRTPTKVSHRLLDELDIPSEALLDLIDGASRLKMAVHEFGSKKSN